MRKLGLVLLVLLITAVYNSMAAGVSLSYQLSPEILLPGDYADAVLVISNPSTTKDVKVNSVVIHSYSSLTVEPQGIYSIGRIPPGGSYTLSFSVKANDKGRYNLEVVVSTDNGTVTQNIQVVVDDSFPSLTVTSPVYRNEVNELEFYVSSPVELKDVRVEALFNATPGVVYLGNVNSGGAEGSFKFLPDSDTLKFKISFYNGRNYHEVKKIIKIRLLDSRNVVVNVSSPYKTLYIGDSITIPVEITNLRSDEINSITVSATSTLGTFSDPVEVAKLQSGESKTLNFKFSPSKSGEDSIRVEVEYHDEFGNKYHVTKTFPINVLDSLAVSITNLNVVREGLEVSVSGDVSNNGRSEVYNAYAVASCGSYQADYFIGNIDPSDFQSFDLPIKCNKSVLITVSWSNELGETFELHKEINLGEKVPVQVEESNMPIIVSIVVAVIVFAIVGLIIYRQIRK